jgi:hypothetical protein
MKVAGTFSITSWAIINIIFYSYTQKKSVITSQLTSHEE